MWRYVAADGWTAYRRPPSGGKLDDQRARLKERFFRQRGNVEVVRQDLVRERSIDVILRTVERAVAPYRRLMAAEAKATTRFETPPGGSCRSTSSSCERQSRPAGTRLPVRGDAGLFPSWRSRISARRLSSAGWKAPTRCWVDNPRALVGNHDTATRRGRVQRPVLAFAGH